MTESNPRLKVQWYMLLLPLVDVLTGIILQGPRCLSLLSWSPSEFPKRLNLNRTSTKNYIKPQSNIIILYLPAHHTHIIYYNHIVFPCTPHTNTRTEACRRNVMLGGKEEEKIWNHIELPTSSQYWQHCPWTKPGDLTVLGYDWLADLLSCGNRVRFTQFILCELTVENPTATSRPITELQ